MPKYGSQNSPFSHHPLRPAWLTLDADKPIKMYTHLAYWLRPIPPLISTSHTFNRTNSIILTATLELGDFDHCTALRDFAKQLFLVIDTYNLTITHSSQLQICGPCISIIFWFESVIGFCEQSRKNFFIYQQQTVLSSSRQKPTSLKEISVRNAQICHSDLWETSHDVAEFWCRQSNDKCDQQSLFLIKCGIHIHENFQIVLLLSWTLQKWRSNMHFPIA